MSDTTTDTSTRTGDDQDLGAAGSQLSTAPVEDSPSPDLPSLGVIGWARWFWRQLTSMRVALLLLLLLSLAAIPGSLIPQTGINEAQVADFRERHDVLAPVYDKLGLFNVYSSVWFSAIYILLFVSLIGCIVPRTWQFVGQLRGRPPGAPRRLTRLPAHTTWRTSADPEEVREAALALLRKRRFRAHAVGDAVAAEKGYLRELGNLAFHLALIVMLIAFAWGQLFKSEGNKIVVEGDGFSNTLTQYDDFKSGNLFTNDDLEPFSFDVEEFTGTYERTGPNRGTPRTYETEVTYTEGADGEEKNALIKVNKPLEIGDAKVYLVSHGYAPVVTVRDGKGEIVYQDAVPLLPLDNNVTSNGVVKVLDGYRNPQGKKEQLGFQAFFVPTFGGSASGTMLSQFPALDYPVLALNAYHGDLKADSGIPQSVYQMDKTKMKEFKDADGELLKKLLTPGETMTLPGGAGSITFEKDIKEWAGFQVVQEPGGGWALGGALAAIGGLAASLFVQRRRVWVRAVRGDDGVTVVEMAGLGRSESAKVPEELGDLAGTLYERAPGVPDPEPDGAPEPDGTPPEDPGAPGASGTTTSTDTDSQAVPAEGAEQQ
ncbi:cytochrome c biogenesis protein ResB [Streptomyces griseoincarnatus]|uniref:cytochrome c biogenesis protein ResB n=1 Tax=unclassified Streptomyces TaxID=2593676 RepID=UPI000E0AFB11|nr:MULTISPECIES: cytochrome c biogenesis protein ResB [unclassified Streptomyces]AXI88055.1 cytochrome C biogenesis protein [Streptomyces sp. ETH9427]